MSARCTNALPTLGTQIIGLANSDFVPCLASSLFLFSLLPAVNYVLECLRLKCCMDNLALYNAAVIPGPKES